jgi:hypothetical protein
LHRLRPPTLPPPFKTTMRWRNVIISREERARELGALRAIDASRARRELAWISAIVASWLVVSLVLMLAG